MTFMKVLLGPLGDIISKEALSDGIQEILHEGETTKIAVNNFSRALVVKKPAGKYSPIFVSKLKKSSDAVPKPVYGIYFLSGNHHSLMINGEDEDSNVVMIFWRSESNEK